VNDIPYEENERTIISEVNEELGDSGWDLKEFILGFLFYRFLSEKITYQVNQNQENAKAPYKNYTVLEDEIALRGKKSIIEEFGYHIPPSELFEKIVENATNDPNLNETLSCIFSNIEASAVGSQSESSFKGLFRELDLNSERLGSTVKKRNETLAKYLRMVASWQLTIHNSEHSFGNIFESLIGNFASKVGKKGGNFFTPRTVSELLVNLALTNHSDVKNIYDPACGSGSLLLKFTTVLGKTTKTIEYFGQDEDLTFYNFCRINMLLHNVSFDEADIEHGDTLVNPKHINLDKFDVVVSNPRFSKAWEGDSNPLLINDPRFSSAGVLAPKGKHDMAFIMHSLYALNEKGVAVLAEHPGVMYRSKNEQKIRKYLIESNYIDCVIQLPPNLFFGVTIAPNILILKKARETTDVLFINADKHFVRNGNKNILNSENIRHIMDIYVNRADIDFTSRVVGQDEIRAKDYLLTVTGYIHSEDIREKVDIQTVNSSIKEIVRKQNELRTYIDTLVNDLEGTPL